MREWWWRVPGGARCNIIRTQTASRWRARAHARERRESREGEGEGGEGAHERGEQEVDSGGFLELQLEARGVSLVLAIGVCAVTEK